MGGLSHTVSGDIASFRTPSRVPIESLKFHFLPKQAAGTPTPENPIPIEGWTGLNGRRAGKNLLNFNKNLYLNPHTAGGITFTAHYNADGSLSHINVKGTKTSTNVFYNLNYVAPGIPMKAGHYIVSGMISGKVEIQAFEYNPNETLILNTARGIFDFEVHSGNTKSWIRLQVTTDEYIDEDVYPMLMVYPCSDTEYETYSEEQIPITFPTNGKNLVNDETTTLKNWTTKEGRRYISTNTDTRDSVSIYVVQYGPNDVVLKNNVKYTPVVIGRNSLTIDVVKGCNKILLKHNGVVRDFGVFIPWDGRVGTYTISANFESIDLSTVGGFIFSDVQIELGDTMTSYEIYSSDNTFYGGYIDPVAGEIVAEYVSKICDGSENGWNTNSTSGSNTRFHIAPSGLGLPKPVNSSTSLAKFSYFNSSTSPSAWNGFIGSTGNVLFFVPTDTASTVAEWKEYLSEHNLQICYKLAEPIHIPIPAQDLKAFLDHNNFWSDANDITEVTYPITESKDILATRKKAIAFDHAHHKKLKWNQLVPISSVSSSIVHGQSDGSILIQGTTDKTDFVVLTSKTQYFTEITGHKYFLCGNPITNGDAQMLTTTQYRSATLDTGYGTVYESERDSDTVRLQMRLVAGTYDFTIVPVFIDLTVMFGAGKEPSTVDEFKHICEINGIDLTTYQPYDKGSDRWLIIP